MGGLDHSNLHWLQPVESPKDPPKLEDVKICAASDRRSLFGEKTLIPDIVFLDNT